MKKILVLIMLGSCVIAHGQVVVSSRYQPMTYDQIAAPLQQQTNAFNEAVNQFGEYYTKGLEAYSNGNYESAKFYFEYCSRLNKKWDYRIYDQSEIRDRIAACNQRINNR